MLGAQEAKHVTQLFLVRFAARETRPRLHAWVMVVLRTVLHHSLLNIAFASSLSLFISSC